MSTIQVTGTLLSPLSIPIYPATIRVTALDSANNTPECAEALHETLPSGFYDFPLIYGRYLVEVNSKDEYCEITEVIVDEATPNPINLTDLARYAKPVLPPTVVPDDPNWEDLYYQLRSHHNTTLRELTNQLRDGESFISDGKQIVQNATLNAEISEEVQSISTDNADLVSTKNTYSDANNHESVVETINFSTRATSAIHRTELNEASNGNAQYLREYTFNGQSNVIDERTFYDAGTIANRHTYSIGSNSFGSTQDISSDEANNTETFNFVSGDTTITSKREVTAKADFDLLGNPEVILSDGVTFDYTTFNSSIDNYQRIYLTPTENIVAEMKRGVTVYGSEMYDLYENDGFTSTRTTRADTINYEGTDGDKLVEIDTIADTVTVNGRLIVTNSEDFKGDPGIIFYFEYQYAATNSNNGADWHDEFDPINDRWRRQREVSGTAENPIYGAWSGGFLLNAEDGADGDPIYIEYRYNSDPLPTTDPSWHETMETGDDWRIERTIQNGVPITPWSSPARIRGYDGDDAYVTEMEYQYAINANDPDNLWHYNFTTGDHFRRERLVLYANQSDYVGNIPILPLPPWNNIAQIAPINGVDYGIRVSTLFIYKRGDSVGDVGLPSGTLTYNFDDLTLTPTGNLNGWSQEIPEAGEGDIYVAVATVIAAGYGDNVPTDDVAPHEWDVTRFVADGKIPSTIFLYKESETTPTKNFTSATRNVYTGAVTISPSGTGWSATPTISDAAGAKLWYITDVKLVDSDATTSSHLAAEFSNPELFSQNGQDGAAGAQGDHGAGSVYTTAPKPTLNSQITIDYNNAIGKPTSTPVPLQAVISYVDSLNPALATPGYRVDYIYTEDNPSLPWEAFVSVIDGNQIVYGSVAAEHIVAATFTGDEFNASARVIVGAGNTTAGINGLDSGSYSGWRFWSGALLPADADFRIDSTGHLYADNATIAGNVTATSGAIANTVINGTWLDVNLRSNTGVSGGLRIKDLTLNAEKAGIASTNTNIGEGLTGKVAIWAGGNASTATFKVSEDGDMYAQNARVVGDISGSSFNGLKIKMGSFPSTVDGDETININTYEGRIYNPNTGSYTSHGTTAGFTQLVGVSLSHMGPAATTTADMNFPKIVSSNSFIFNRDDQFNGTEYFSYMAWGV